MEGGLRRHPWGGEIMTTTAYDSLTVSGLGLDALFAESANNFSLVFIDQIDVKGQIRQIFEDDENSLSELAESIKTRGMLQPILIRPNPNSKSSAPYELVAGERRYLASKMIGLEQIPAYIREFTDEEAEDAQYAENVQRKNLTQIEEAKKLQRDIDRLGSTEAVLQKHNKSNAWLSKMVGLLRLPEQAKRLIEENISADIEVIHGVKAIEKRSPAEAKALVEELKSTPMDGRARDKVAKVKDKVKPLASKQPKPAPRQNFDALTEEATTSLAERILNLRTDTVEMAVPVVEPEVLKSPETKMQEETVTEDQGFLPALLPEAVNSLGLVLKIAYHRICVNGESPVYVLNSLAEEDRNNATAWLQTHYNAGAKSKTLSIDVLNGLRAGVFDKNGDGAFAMVAYLHGATAWLDFNMVDILRGAKEQ
jgi:ParB family chromosome partitioning protein